MPPTVITELQSAYWTGITQEEHKLLIQTEEKVRMKRVS